MGNYRRVLALPGVTGMLTLTFLARIPMTATSMVLTLHVVLTLHHGYGAAGLIGAATFIGAAIGAPMTGRMVDRFGLRRMVVVTTVGSGVYWLTAWALPYAALLPLAVVGGLVTLPVMSIGRQSLAALVPETHRRTGYSLDSISVEMSFMIGPAAGVLVATKLSTITAVVGLGCLQILAGIAIYLVNPPVRSADEASAPVEPAPSRSSWLRPPLVAALVVGFGAVFTLVGTEIAVVAALRGAGQVGWTGIVVILMCLASMTGGLVYGALRKAPGPLLMMTLLGAFVVPVGLAGGQWWAVALALVPSNLMCAPTLAATGDLVSRLAPATVRGEAMGWHSAALTLGGGLGGPLIGTVIDQVGPAGGFVAAGAGGLLVAAFAVPLARRKAAPEIVGEPAAVSRS
jgi:MFS family permease